ncbi:MAG: hypothetical protein JST61_12310 [Acidobacteria bacterium]|nr:hypothetical protein [Acidobacteriota bacterium]
MKLLFSLVLSALFMVPTVSRAQIGLYVNPVAARVSNSQADHGVFAFLGDGSTSRMFWGANLGGYYDRWHGEKYDAGIDIRDTIMGANNARLNNFLIGARVVATSWSPKWRPYAQLSGGVGTTRAPHSTVKTSRATFGAFVGADYKLSRVIDVRAFEIGYGSLTTISSATVGSAVTSFPSSNVLQVSAGLVFRIR